MDHCHDNWLELNCPTLPNKVLATVSMEGYIPELQGDTREANTKGGLGVYFGDKLEGLATIGMHKAFGCMPMYHRRLVQEIQLGRQVLSYRDVSYEDQPVARLLDPDQRPVTLEVWGFDTANPNQEIRYEAEVFSVVRGGTRLYMFSCPPVFDVLYPDDATHHNGRRHRFLQETLMAQCVIKLFKTLEVVPDALLINEGHVAVAAAITRGDPTFEKTAILYTNHTVVPAGLEVFDALDLADNDLGRARYIMRFPPNSWQWLWQKFIVECDGKILIDFSKGAMEICSAANAVSAEHARATRSLLLYGFDLECEVFLAGDFHGRALGDVSVGLGRPAGPMQFDLSPRLRRDRLHHHGPLSHELLQGLCQLLGVPCMPQEDPLELLTKN